MTEQLDGRTRLEQSIHQRLAEIEQRLTELRQARPEAAGGGGQRILSEARQHAHEADRHWRDSIAHGLLVQRFVEQAFRSAARAHDHAADASERAARVGIGDVAEYRRRAEFHRAAAEADRQRADEMRCRLAGPDQLG